MSATFRVQDYVEIRLRGVFLFGRIESGTVRVGDSVEGALPLTVAAIEFADNLSTRESWVCLRFVENPSKSELAGRFPIGATLTLHD